MLLDVYQRAQEELFDEATDAFIVFHGRRPTLGEEGTIFENISVERVKHKISSLLGMDNDIEMNDESIREIEGLLDKSR